MNNTHKKIKQPNNRAIALLIGLNIFVSFVILYHLNNSEVTKVDNTVAYASNLSAEETEAIVKKAKEEAKEEDVIYEVTSITNVDAKVNSIPLYFSHMNDEGAFFTHTPTEKGTDWILGYWFVDFGTLAKANINPVLLQHNDMIEGVYYPNDIDDYFEIKEVMPDSESYTFKK